MDDQQWRSVQALLTSGGVVGFPTETVWGLGASAALPSALNELQRRKGRAANKAFQVSCSSVEQMRALSVSSARLEALLALLPAPLTLVAEASAQCPAWLSQSGKVGLRLPQHPLARELTRRCGPLITTSFNPAGQAAALTSAQAQHYQRSHLLADLLLDGPPPPSGLPSSVIDCSSGEILREGAVPRAVLAAALEQAQ